MDLNLKYKTTTIYFRTQKNYSMILIGLFPTRIKAEPNVNAMYYNTFLIPRN